MKYIQISTNSKDQLIYLKGYFKDTMNLLINASLNTNIISIPVHLKSPAATSSYKTFNAEQFTAKLLLLLKEARLIFNTPYIQHPPNIG